MSEFVSIPANSFIMIPSHPFFFAFIAKVTLWIIVQIRTLLRMMWDAINNCSDTKGIKQTSRAKRSLQQSLIIHYCLKFCARAACTYNTAKNQILTRTKPLSLRRVSAFQFSSGLNYKDEAVHSITPNTMWISNILWNDAN